MLHKPTNTVKCSVCGKTIEVPNISLDRDRECLKPFCCAAIVFTVQYLIHEGWHIRNLGITDKHPYFCPDCWKKGTPEFLRSEYCDDWYQQSQKWLKKKTGGKEMTNEEKAVGIGLHVRDVCISKGVTGDNAETASLLVQQSAMEMAEWKDEQFKEYLEENLSDIIFRCINEYKRLEGMMNDDGTLRSDFQIAQDIAINEFSIINELSRKTKYEKL